MRKIAVLAHSFITVAPSWKRKRKETVSIPPPKRENLGKLTYIVGK
jgi:hypothetical protein